MKKALVTGLMATMSIVAMAAGAVANDKLNELSKSNENWIMPGKNYSSNNFSDNKQINTENVKGLKAAWSFSTGLRHGH